MTKDGPIWLVALAVGSGAALGAMLRWALSYALNAKSPLLPLGTLSANLLGGYLIGLVAAGLASHPSIPPAVRLFLITGFLGGLTTFSTFSSEAVALLGGSETVYWLKVGLPNLLPSILGTFSVLFANAVAAYATAYALMQNNFALLPIKITEQFVGDVVQRREFGSALAVVLMLLMTATIAINDKILKMRTKKAK